MRAPVDEICNIIKTRNNFLIASHAMPDGDAVGAQIGMGLILRNLNKNFQLYNISGLPGAFDWINPGLIFNQSLHKIDNFIPEICIFLDCGDVHRSGPEIATYFANNEFPLTISIDHHRDNPEFAIVNWVDSTASATAYLVGLLAKTLDMPLTGQLGEAIYLGLVEDTGSFSYGNTDARTLAMAAEIVEAGLNVGQFNACRENTWSMERFRFWGRLANDIHMTHNNTIAYICITHKMLDEAGLTIADLKDFASWMRRIRGTKICAMIRENAPNRIKVSLRSEINTNIQKVAVYFGGGGHANAAAMELDGSVESTVETIMPQLIKAVNAASSSAVC